MINSYIKIPDNVGASFEIVNGRFILQAPEPTFVGLDASLIGHFIPYFAKNLLSTGATEWEAGIGKVISTTIVEREEVSGSSNNDELVFFSFGGTKTFFVYPNQYSVDLGYNNLITSTGVFNIGDVRSTYVVDLSTNHASGTLPVASGNRGLILDFKAYNRNNKDLHIIASSGDLIDGSASLTIDYDNAYTSLVSNGSGWIELKNEVNLNIDPDLMGTPQGPNGSIQYKVNSTSFGGSNIYYSNASNSLLFGGTGSEQSADTVISGSGTTIFNKTSKNTDFIINGSGNRNCIFDASGKIGLNLPSGAKPATLLHIVGQGCDSNIRLENRSSCSTPKLVLYHKPSTTLDSGSLVGSIHLAGKNSVGSEIDYSQIRTRAISSQASSPSGELVVSINNGGSSLDSLTVNSDSVAIRNKNRQLQISTSGVIADKIVVSDSLHLLPLSISGSILSVGQSGILESAGYTKSDLASIGTKASLSGAIFSGNITAPRINAPALSQSSGSYIDFSSSTLIGNWNIGADTILAKDTNNTSDQGSVLTHTGSGIAWSKPSADNFIWSGLDISWEKYPIRSCFIQNGGDVLAISAIGLSNEFSVGDTVKISVNTNNYFRTINSITESNGYTNIVLNQILPISGTGNIFSINKGGYLNLSVENSGAPAISPQTTISCRPLTNTIFNQNKHSIDFQINGESVAPAIYVNAKPSNRLEAVSATVINGSSPKIVQQSGNLNRYASLSVSGYIYTDSISIGQTPVPSGYILTSTSGNIAQWQSTNTISDLDGGVIVFSGVSL
jgi:hypothetical protein